MTPPSTALGIIFGIVFVDLVGFGIVIPVLPLYAERFGASPLVIGMLLGVYSLMQALCAPLLGRLSDRVGRRPVLLLSVFGTAAGFLLMGLARTLPWLFAGRIIDGATGGNISTALAYIADISPPEHRSKRMGLIGAAFGLGLIVGPAIGGLLSHVSLAAPLLFAAGLSGLNALAVVGLLPESLPAERRRQAQEQSGLAPLLAGAPGRRLRAALATYFCTTVAFSLLTAIYPLFTQRRFGYGAAENGYIFAGQGILGAVIQGGLLGWLLRYATDKTLVICGTAVLTLSLFVLPLSATASALWLATAGVAIGHGFVAAPLNGLASKGGDAAMQGRVLGLMQSAASAARIIGPVLGGWLLTCDARGLAEVFGRTPYWVGGVIMSVACLLAFLL